MRLALTLLVFVAFSPCFAASSSQSSTAPSHAVTPGAPGTGDTLVIFDALCRALQDNYPMLELAGWRNDSVEQFRSKIAHASTEEDGFELMDELVCRLNDYHTRLSWPGKPRLASPPIRVEPVLTRSNLPPPFGVWGLVRPPIELPPLDGVAIAVLETQKGCGLEPGDEILSVDGAPVQQALARSWPHSVGSSVAGKLRWAANRMLAGEPQQPLTLVVRTSPAAGHRTTTLTVPRTGNLARALIATDQIEGVPVLRISQWSNRPGEDLATRFDELLAQVRNRPGLILDVRGNGGGEDNLAGKIVGRFLSRPVIASISFHRLVPTLNYERTVDWIAPRGPWRYDGRVVVLADEGCMSACEHFVSGMLEAGAVVCGTPTSGACGWIRSVDLPGGVKLDVSQTFPLHAGGIPSPQLGIAPHLWAPRSLADLQAGKDTALCAALACLKNTNAVPQRLQPLAPL